MSRKAGESWDALCGTRKAVWKAKADEKKVKHARKHSDYRYRPKRRHRSPKEDDSSKPPKGRRNQIELEGPGSSLSNSSVLPISKAQNHLFSQNEQSNEASSSVECTLARPISRRAFTTNDGLWTPALNPVNIARSGIVYPNLPSSERNSTSPGGNQALLSLQNDAALWFEHGVLDGQHVPELTDSPSTSASSLFDMSDTVSAPSRNSSDKYLT